MYKKPLIYSLVIISLFAASCGKKTNKNPNSKQQDNGTTNAVAEADDDYLKYVHIKPGEKVKLDNPRVFIEIGILFNHEQKKWLAELRAKNAKQAESLSNTNTVTNVREYGMDEDKFLENKRKEFYKQFGLSESLMGSYNVKHYQEIENYLNEHEDIKKAYENSGSSNMDQNY